MPMPIPIIRLFPLLELYDGRRAPSVGAKVGGKVRKTKLGCADGCLEGGAVGSALGCFEGDPDGWLLTVGFPDGDSLGMPDGCTLTDGAPLGCLETDGWNETDGAKDGEIDGCRLGALETVGAKVGDSDGGGVFGCCVGAADDRAVGDADGLAEG